MTTTYYSDWKKSISVCGNALKSHSYQLCTVTIFEMISPNKHFWIQTFFSLEIFLLLRKAETLWLVWFLWIWTCPCDSSVQDEITGQSNFRIYILVWMYWYCTTIVSLSWIFIWPVNLSELLSDFTKEVFELERRLLHGGVWFITLTV